MRKIYGPKGEKLTGDWIRSCMVRTPTTYYSRHQIKEN